MKLFAHVLGLALALASLVVAQTPPAGVPPIAKCTSITVRKEIRSLSPAEWATYNRAVNTAMEKGWMDWYGFFHLKIQNEIHKHVSFFVYHRNLVIDFENVLRRYEPTVVIPYWNSVADAQNPPGSPVLGANYLGGNGDPANGNCVTTGIGANWKFVYPTAHCLRRNYGEGSNVQRWFPAEFVTSLFQTETTYDAFRRRIENTAHGAVHASLGGEMNTMFSPEDPVFMIHHANIDRIYAQWQAIDPENRTYMYEGANPDGTQAKITDSLKYSDAHVYDVIRLGYGKACYTYDTILAANGNTLALTRDYSTRNGTAASGTPPTPPRKCTTPNTCERQLVRQLPRPLLKKYFPAFAEGRFNGLATEMWNIHPLQPMAADGPSARAFVPPAPNENMRGKLQYPTPAPESYIKMMHLNVTEVREVEQEARDFIDALNAAGYLSPYLV
ncbi:hypothetical protein H4R18_002044 [Coemansia javaensis]|uniref:Tyrosinase copper-binding domain-containing protein n=1 Tax=Coemansia javaensis TaxID=2761396 RepID=A0A9W8HDB8_9FUNG|nr:hypothetical protein H4R18_002044 [Coemansia javaensis]